MESPALYRGIGRDDLIKLYFEGYSYGIIICFLFYLRPWDIFITPSAEEDIYCCQRVSIIDL